MQPVALQHFFDTLFEPVVGHGRGVAKVELDVEMPGHDVLGAGTGVDIGNLETGRRKEFVAPVPLDPRQFGERRRRQVNRVAYQVRVGDVALLAEHRERAVERSAPAVLERVAKGCYARRLAHQAAIDFFAACFQPFDHLHRAVDRRAFLVGGNQQADRALMVRVLRDEILNRGDERRQRALHVGGAAPVQETVAHHGRERVAGPLLRRAGRHDIGVAGKHHQRLGAAAPRPEVVHVAEAQAMHLEAERLEAFDHQFLAAFILRRKRGAGDELLGQFEGLVCHIIFGHR